MSHNEQQGHSGGHGQASGPGNGVVLALFAVLIFYAVFLAMGLPQKWTNAANHHDDHAVAVSKEEHEEKHTAETEHAAPGQTDSEPAPSEQADAEHKKPELKPPALFTAIPFIVLLLCIAVFPLIPATEHWWEHNSSKFMVAAILGLITLGYYLFFHNSAIEAHWPGHAVVEPAANGLNFGLMGAVFVNAIISEYIAFIVLLFTLYTIAGGIRIQGDLRARPLTNTVIMAIGAVLASFVGTTGAAMLLIRLLLETNKERKIKAHTVIFFIFIVCNCGGLLTPLGDPPLFLGYLKGVHFGYTLTHLYCEWAFVNAALLAVYFLWDTFFAYPREAKTDITKDETATQPLQIQGLMPNILLLAGVICSVLFLDPSKTIGGWHPWSFLREMVMLTLVLISLVCGDKKARLANKFNYTAIVEVAALFFGIFICMQAPIQILNVEGPNLGLRSPKQFYWATGTLSSFLDNAPTYVVFYETAKSLAAKDLSAADQAASIKACGVAIDMTLLAAVSLGAVFMGAMTYIGNGPNFMVKA
ncbi:MAG: sodium:proton antiporter, partial [Planctomycetaceae bacterium]|nr:sodium:proton antiporter [Planctomycetaceae bacterium]